jgi:Uma2 family endonuclease
LDEQWRQIKMSVAIHALDFKAYQPETTYIPKKHKITEEEYWEKYYDDPEVTYEWNNGELEEKGVSDMVTVSMADWFYELLGYYLKTHPIATKTFLEIGFHLALPQKNEVRRPDFGLVLNSNPIPLQPSDKSYQGTFDLCVEAISNSKVIDIKRDTIDKRFEYAQGGVKEYYILDGYNHYTAFYGLNKQGLYVPIKPKKGGVIQSTVLPGFQFRISDLSDHPSPEQMIDDRVYQGFVLPGYSMAKQQVEIEKRARQQAEQQAQEAKQQAETEKKARQEATKRAEQLAQKLRALGINPNEI